MENKFSHSWKFGNFEDLFKTIHNLNSRHCCTGWFGGLMSGVCLWWCNGAVMMLCLLLNKVRGYVKIK
jgi:hypothetical protein